MLHNAMKVNQDLDQIVEFCVKQVDKDTVKSMSAEDLKLMQKLLWFVEDLKEYVEAEAKMMDTINEKLDKLLTSK